MIKMQLTFAEVQITEDADRKPPVRIESNPGIVWDAASR
jgi:hypothetical protein